MYIYLYILIIYLYIFSYIYIYIYISYIYIYSLFIIFAINNAFFFSMLFGIPQKIKNEVYYSF